MNQLGRLYIDEAVRVGTRSMSRELAQLASYFQMALLPEFANQGNTILYRNAFGTKSPPQANLLKECLRELSRITSAPFRCGPQSQQQSQLRFPCGDNLSYPSSTSATGFVGTGGVMTNPLSTCLTAAASAKPRGFQIFHP